MRIHWAIVGVVAVAWMGVAGQQASDPETVLQGTRERILADLARLPRYTCVQTITRRYFYPASSDSRSCQELITAHDRRKGEVHTRAWDRLKLEVAIVEGNSVFSWVGASEFGENSLDEFAGRGPLGSGDFGSFLDSVFRHALIHFQNEDTLQGRRLLEYAYEMPVNLSGYLVRDGSEWVPTAYRGSFLLDPDAMDIVRLTVRTAELPKTNPSCQANTETHYQRVAIHDRMILLPQETRLSAVDRDGSESFNVTTYESCREYASKSRVLASAPSEAPTEAATPPPPVVKPVSAGLSFSCRIVTPIDSETAAAGDPVEAVLRSPLHDKQANLLLPVGSRLHGRLMQLEHRSGAFNTVRLAVEWESISDGTREIPLRAQPDLTSRTGPLSVVMDVLSLGPRTFVFRTDHLRLQNFDWNWITVTRTVDKNGHAGSVIGLPHTVGIADREFSIEAASGIDFKFSVPAGASDVRIEGTFNVIGGNPSEVAVFLFSSSEFPRWRNQEPATTLYESGRTQQGTLNVPLPSGAGSYYLVFSNHFPLSTPKEVQASIRLLYKQ
jgi:hypothetical protein